MDRVYESAVSSTPPTAPETPLLGYPTSGNPATGIPATIQGAWNIHMIMEELRNVIIAAGIEPDAKDVTQLSQAILDIAQRQIPSATETDEGIARLATSAEALSGIGNNTIVTPETMLPAAAHAGMPTGATVNFNVSASGNTYTAPADGYFRFSAMSNAAGQQTLVQDDSLSYLSVYSSATGQTTYIMIPVSNGKALRFTYASGMTSPTVLFFYSIGALP